MRLSGWLRLWIVVSVLYLVLMIVFVAFTLPQASSVFHSSSFYDQMSPELRGKLLAKSIATDPSERNALLDEARKRALIVEVKMPNGHVLVFASDVPQNEQERTAKTYWTIVEKAAAEERRKYFGIAFLWWIIPVLGAMSLAGRSDGYIAVSDTNEAL
jgi:hypothetical protein